MSDTESDDDLHQDESDEETEEERNRRELEEKIEEYIGNHPLVEIGGDIYDRRVVTDIEVGEGRTEIEKHTFCACINLSSIKLQITIYSINYRNISFRLLQIPPFHQAS